MRGPVSSLLLIAACHGAPAEHEAEPVAVHCAALAKTAVDETLLVRGRLEPPPGGDLLVASQVTGRIVSMSVHEGQQVARGDEIALVDDVPSRDALRQAEAGMSQAKSAEVNAQSTLARIRMLVDKGIAAKQELDDAQARAQAAKASVDAASASSDLARRTLGRVTVRSTFAGVITHIFRGAGALVDGTAQTPIAQLASEGSVELVADVTERELLRLQIASQAAITFPSGAPATTGVIRTRSSALDATTGLGVVRIALDHSEAPIGAFGRALVTVAHRNDVLVVPAAALRRSVADGAEVVRCNAGKAEIVSVGVGYRGGGIVEITRGLAAGDRVAVDHVLGLQSGVAISEAK